MNDASPPRKLNLSMVFSRFIQLARRNLPFILTLCALLSAVVTYAVITGSDAPLGLKPRRVLRLMWVNIGLLVLIVGVVAVRIYGLWSSLRIDKAGSKLQKRILGLFGVVTIVPTLIVSVFAALFFNFGIQTWFNERVQTAVEESLMVAEAYLAEHKDNIRADAIAMANDINIAAEAALADPAEFNRIVATQAALRVLTEAIVFQRNHILAQGRLSFALAFERVPQDVLERAAKGEVVILTTDNDKVRALIKIDSLQDAYLLVGRLLDSKVVDHMESVQGAVSEYHTLRKQLDRLQVTFSVVFVTLALLLLLGAAWYGMVFAARLTTPIAKLVQAAERVRAGDFSAQVADVVGKDEIGTLGRAFNRMTEQLQAQRTELIEANRRLDERRRFTEAVLSGVSAGVLALDRNKIITLFNRSSANILSAIDQKVDVGMHINELLPGIAELLVHAEHIVGEEQNSIVNLSNNNKHITLHVRVSVEHLADNKIEGFIVTFDDITLLVAAQRNAAWSDVARRVAHEIKNPLTPIQLAAERLKRKYLKYVAEPDDQETFTKYTDTIAKHVGDIGKIVEEFVSFARMPVPVFKQEDLVGIVKKAVFSAQVANPTLEYKSELPDGTLMMECDEGQITQVLTNVLKNAAEAIEARAPEPGYQGIIRVTLGCEAEQIILRICDNGAGFQAEEAKKLLEPYVTTRSKGTGLGLSIVKKIVEDHKGRISLENISEGGAMVLLSFPQHCDINAAS